MLLVTRYELFFGYEFAGSSQTHICQPYNNSVADNTFCRGTQLFDVPPSAYKPWGVTPPSGNKAIACN